jgi:hypothetical protein
MFVLCLPVFNSATAHVLRAETHRVLTTPRSVKQERHSEPKGHVDISLPDEKCFPQSTHHERGVPNPPLPGGQLSRRAASGETPNDLTVGRGPWREYFFRPRFGSAGPYFEQRFELVMTRRT